jgi:hypothetical protein
MLTSQYLATRAMKRLLVAPTDNVGVNPAFFNKLNGRFVKNYVGYGSLSIPDAAAGYLSIKLRHELDQKGR